MDAVSWLDSCQPEAVAILGNNRWNSGLQALHISLIFTSPCLSGHKNMTVVVKGEEDFVLGHYRAKELSTENELV